MAQDNCTLPSTSIQISFQRSGNTSYFENFQGTCSEILITGIYSCVSKEPNFNYAVITTRYNKLISCSHCTSDLISLTKILEYINTANISLESRMYFLTSIC